MQIDLEIVFLKEATLFLWLIEVEFREPTVGTESPFRIDLKNGETECFKIVCN